MKPTALTVNPAGPWRLYSPIVPPGSVALGTVTREDGATGALVRYCATGVYCQCNAGVIRSLDQRAVGAALEAQS